MNLPSFVGKMRGTCTFWRAACCIALLCGSFLCSAKPAQAVSVKDLQIAGRVLIFLSPPLTGNVTLGIVYKPGDAGSVADEKALVAIIGSGLQIEGINLVALPLPLAKLDSTRVGVYFLTADLGKDAAKVGAWANSQRRLCITMDLAATQAGDCTVAVQSDPSVKITVNKQAAEAGGIEFVTAFLLMISEI